MDEPGSRVRVSSDPVSRPITPWPPLITGERRPRWVGIRDTFLTLLAWFVLGWLLRDLIHLVFDFLRPPRFELTIAAPHLGAVWARLRYFVTIATVFIAWLALVAAIDRRRLQAAERIPQPGPLTIAEEARSAGLDESRVSGARTLKVINVLFRSDGTIAGFQEVRHAAQVSSVPPSP